ncbi:MAG: hypothetical protein QOJ09_2601 [Actinomycetota bacterium]|jgi:uncharacterized cupredoxin-like copper-binding protein|nr:hypothetical protein [Actinomycetota bacterium]
MKNGVRTGLFLILLVAVGACGSSGDNNTASNDTNTTKAAPAEKTGATVEKVVHATLKEFAITVSPARASAGEVHFKLDNKGAIEHEFVVFQSDLDPAKLPLNADGNVDENGAGVKHIGEQEHVMPKTPMDFSISLDAGNYVVVCNLPSHYKAGMHAKLVVV